MFLKTSLFVTIKSQRLFSVIKKKADLIKFGLIICRGATSVYNHNRVPWVCFANLEPRRIEQLLEPQTCTSKSLLFASLRPGKQAQETPLYFTCTVYKFLSTWVLPNLQRFLTCKELPFLPPIRMVLGRLSWNDFVDISFINKINFCSL